MRLELLELRGRIQSQVQGQLSQSQREFYLREQLKAIQKELGEGDETTRELDDLRQQLEAAGMPEEVKTEAMRELTRLGRIPVVIPGLRSIANVPGNGWRACRGAAYLRDRAWTSSAPPRSSMRTTTTWKR